MFLFIKKYAIFSLVTLIISCCSHETTTAYNEQNTHAGLIKEYNKYQTFNEFKMIGEGEVIDSPFVYVKKKNNSIYVRVSNNLDSVIRYEYHKESGYWYNERYIDWDKRYFTKNDIYGPRKYSRYIFCDTIIEIIESTIEMDEIKNGNNYFGTQFFVKTPKGCLLIQFSEEKVELSQKEKLNDIKRIIANYNMRTNLMTIDRYVSIFRGDGFLWFDKEIKGDTLFYICDTKKTIFTLRYPLNSLGEFGCGPGLEIRSDDLFFYDTAKNGAEKTKDNAYTETSVDKKAQFVDGQENLDKYIHENLTIPSTAVLHGKREIVILNLKIDASGKVIGHEVSLARGEILDNAAIEFCYKRLKFTPAIDDGKKVASWLVVPVRFYKDL